MNEYTASNTATVTRYTESLNVALRRTEVWIPPWAVDALREFLRAEEDERLGRWRHTDELVVYAEDSGGVRVLDERMPHLSNEFRREHFHSGEGPNSTTLREAARAYFDAHPEPKPWHEAKEGEVWLITYDGTEYPAIFQADRFRDHGGSWDADSITAARRIWPPEES